MKRRFIPLLLAIIFVGSAVLAERVSARHANHFRNARARVQQQLYSAQDRTIRAEAERARYDTIINMARIIQGRLHWQNDTTALLRWFAEEASACGLRLQSARILPEDKTSLNAGDGFQHLRFELHAVGDYGPMTNFVEAIEASPSPMIIEQLTINADRSETGGDLKMTVTSFYPLPNKETANEQTKN